MSTPIIPKFNLKSSLSEAQMVEIEAAASVPKDSKWFKPGKHSVEIVKATIHGVSAGDPTWMTVCLELGSESRRLKTFILVPTEHYEYKKVGIKNPMILMIMLRKLLEALGEDHTITNLDSTLPALFADPSVLEGRTLEVEIGYKGYYVDWVAKDDYRIFERDGKEFRGDEEKLSYRDRDSAIADAANFNITIEKFPEVLKFYPPKEDETPF